MIQIKDLNLNKAIRQIEDRNLKGQVLWYIPVISATQEVQIERIICQS
jgi:hypothetical protein